MKYGKQTEGEQCEKGNDRSFQRNNEETEIQKPITNDHNCK